MPLILDGTTSESTRDEIVAYLRRNVLQLRDALGEHTGVSLNVLTDITNELANAELYKGQGVK